MNDARGRKRSAGGRWLLLGGGGGQQRGGGSGSGDATRRGARGAWLRPVGDVLTASRSAAARMSGAPLFRRWRADADDAR
jgi:hypothetical protein